VETDGRVNEGRTREVERILGGLVGWVERE